MELWHSEYCMGIEKPQVGIKVVFHKCRSTDPLQKWEHTRVSMAGSRAGARALTEGGGGGVYSSIRVMPD